MRRAYGWAKRQMVAHPIWDNQEYKHYFQFLRESQWWSLNQLEAYQLEQLQSLVRHAYDHVPYYRRVFDEHGMKPGDIVSLEDRYKIPFLTREDVRVHREELVATNIPREKLNYWTTGGTEGTPIGVFHNGETCDLYESAFRKRQWAWAGYRFRDPIARIRRNPITRTNRGGQPVLWDYITDENALIFSAGDLDEHNMHIIVDRLRRFQPRFINSCPSALEILARFLNRHGNGHIRPKAIFAMSETLYPWQREIIETEFGCPVFAEYGLSELAADATECEQHQGYHVSMEYCLLELVDENLQPVTQPGITGRVVGTGFHTASMPMIRYLTNDLAVYADKPCTCGRHLTLIKEFQGRRRELLVSKQGKQVPLQVIFSGHTPIWGKIRELNFLQEQKGVLVARVVEAPECSQREVSHELLSELRKTLHDSEFDIHIAFVERVPRTVSGKLRYLEQRLNIDRHPEYSMQPVEVLKEFQ
jgi:phenylacetate-CoA ligase